MQFAKTNNFEQTIILEIKSDSHIFSSESIEFIDNGIRIALP